LVDGSGATSWERSGIAADEGERIVFVAHCKILSPDPANAVEVCEIVDDKVARFAGCDFTFSFGI
jgi:hypothetical protein